MIKSITLQNLRNGEFLQFCKDTVSIIGLNNPATLLVQDQHLAFETMYTEVAALFKIQQANPFTVEVEALDARRDAAINGLIFVIQGFSYSFDPTIQKQATILSNHLGQYGSGIAKDNYQSETASLDGILNDWTNKPELAAAVVALNLGSWQAELKTANDAFNAKYLTRTQDLGAASNDTLKAKRLEASRAFYALRDTLDAYYTIRNGAEPFSKCSNELNALIDQYNTLLAGRVPEPGVAAKPAGNTPAVAA
ncbi:MAG: DUF6261 family protein [Chitinophagaceae bacterium]